MRTMRCSEESDYNKATDELVELQRNGKLGPEQIKRFYEYTSNIYRSYANSLDKHRDFEKATVDSLRETIEKYGRIVDYVGVHNEPKDKETNVDTTVDDKKDCASDDEKKKDAPKGKKKKGERSKPKGGRNKGTGNRSAKDYPKAARRQYLLGKAAAPGQPCPCCKESKLYSIASNETHRFLSSPEIIAMVLEIQRSRCTSCGTVFGAELPTELLKEQCIGKFTAAAAAEIIFTKYGAGIPNARLSTIQGYHDTPIADSTMWNVTSQVAAKLYPLWSFLAQANADGDSRMVDDGSAFIIQAKLQIAEELENAEAAGFDNKDVRTGTNITCWKFDYKGEKYRFFAAGRAHQGEREFQLSQMRKVDSPLVRMSDAGGTTGALKPMPAKNELGFTPMHSGAKPIKEPNTFKAYCLQHLRSHIIDASGGFAAEKAHLLEQVNKIFAFDRDTTKMTAADRLAYHQQNSKPVMDAVFTFATEQKQSNKLAEPNCDYGKLLGYITRQWTGFTLFLRMESIEISTNDIEREGVKFTKRYKKASLGFQTFHGADVGCFFMSLIATCLAEKKNPIHYLDTMITFSNFITIDNAIEWMPQTYEETAKKFKVRLPKNVDGYRARHRIKKDPEAQEHRCTPHKMNLDATAALH